MCISKKLLILAIKAFDNGCYEDAGTLFTGALNSSDSSVLVSLLLTDESELPSGTGPGLDLAPNTLIDPSLSQQLATAASLFASTLVSESSDAEEDEDSEDEDSEDEDEPEDSKMSVSSTMSSPVSIG